MKKKIQIKLTCIVILLLAAGLLFAGGKGESPDKEMPEKETMTEKADMGPKRGQSVTAGIMVKITSLDPPNGNAFSGEGNVYIAMYDRLLRKDEQGNFVPELATSWDFSADGKQLTFKLRQGVSFHDGTPFNAEAAKFNLDRLLNPEEATQAYRFFTDLESIDAVDANTVRLNLKRPSSIILDALTYRGGFMLSPTALKTYGEDYNQHPSGTGPFKFVEWIPGNRCVVTRNENFWDKDKDGESLPYLDKVTFRQITDDSVRIIELQTGNAHMVVRVPAESMDIVRNDPNLDLIQTPTATTFRLYLNMRKPPFNDPNLRRALNYAFDREAMAASLLPGQGSVNPFMMLPNDPFYSRYTPYNYDPEKAKKLVADAGFPDGMDVEFMMISREPDVTIAPVVQSYLNEIGIRTQILPLERLIYVDKAKTGNFELSMAQITLPLPAIYLTLVQQLHSDGPVNRAAWKNSEFDALLDELAVTFDTDKQKEIIGNLQKVCLDDAGQTFLFSRDFYHGHSKKLRGVEFQHEGVWRFHEIWLDE